MTEITLTEGQIIRALRGIVPVQGGRSRLVGFGDSIIALSYLVNGNITSNPGGLLTWFNILANQRFEHIPTVHNLGIAGNTTGQMLARIDTLLALDPQIVVFSGGGNDWITNVPAATTIANLNQIFDRVLASGASLFPLILIATQAPHAKSDAQVRTALTVNEWIKQYAVGKTNFFPVDCGL